MRFAKLVFMFAFLIIFIYACSDLVDPMDLDMIDITVDLSNGELTNQEASYNASLELVDGAYHLELIAVAPYFFTNDITLYINGISVDEPYTITATSILLIIENLSFYNPLDLADVEVVFDLDHGYFTEAFFDHLTPDQTLTLTSYDDILGKTFTLFDASYSTLRWFYKLFLNYNADFEAYEVVYKDPATAAISLLDLPAYDYILAVHDQTEDLETKSQIIEYTSSDDGRMFIVFDGDVSSYTSGELDVHFYTEAQISGRQSVIMNESEVLPVPIKETFTFMGWKTESDQITSIFPGYQKKDNIKTVTYTAVWEGATLETLNQYLESLVPDKITGDLDLPLSYGGFDITWVSSDTDVISNEGAYQRPYVETTVELVAYISRNDETSQTTFFIQADGYKSLEAPIASSYIYRNYSSVNDAFFEILDIINTAFIIAEPDGTLVGTNFLYNVQTHIMPKAKIHGNWVILSIAPESAWSTISASTTLINTFADEIVRVINTYGFDGVDIDWETPTNAERTRYTQLMRIVYEKVKANNPNHLVTTAITGGMWQPPQYDLLNSAPYIDYINVMTYGMTSNGAQYQNALYPSSDFHNPTFLAGRTLISCSIEESVAIFNNQYAIPNNKLIIGVAFYGIRQERSFNQTTQSWTAWTNAGSVFYDEIISQYLTNDDYIKAYDRDAGVPYLLKSDGTVFISYDNPRSIAEKSQYIIDQGLAGMMFWEYGTDTSGTLLYAVGLGFDK